MLRESQRPLQQLFRVVVAYLASFVALSFSAAPTLIFALTAFAGWSYFRECRNRRQCRNDCVKNVSECENQDNLKVIGFLGLVGREPDVARGLLVDTGASINVHGANWFEQFTQLVLKPWRLWSTDFSIKGASITGVEGGSVGTNLGQCVPGNISGYNSKGKKVNIPISFTSQQIKGNAPALLGLPALIQMGAIIDTRTHSMTIDYEGEDVVVQLIHTRSGHYVLPLDAFDESKMKAKAYEQGCEKMSLYVREDETDDSLERIYEVDWNDYVAEQKQNEILQRITATGPHKYLKINKSNLDILEQLAMGHKVKPTYRRTAIAQNNPRDATGRYST